MSETKTTLNIRTAASPGRVHFGISSYSWEKLEAINLAHEATPEQVENIALELIAAAKDARTIGKAFPNLVPLDDTKAIDAPTQAEAVEEEHEAVPTTGHEDDEPFDPEARAQDS